MSRTSNSRNDKVVYGHYPFFNIADFVYRSMVEDHVDIEIKRLSGDGFAGYLDGQLTSAQFNQPRNFAVDLKGNIYVADRRNHAIRKITASGTIHELLEP